VSIEGEQRSPTWLRNPLTILDHHFSPNKTLLSSTQNSLAEISQPVDSSYLEQPAVPPLSLHKIAVSAAKLGRDALRICLTPPIDQQTRIYQNWRWSLSCLSSL
jgi:hypothetical protein